MKSNVTRLQECYGCGVCAASCPKKIISIRLNQDGFYEPVIDDIGACIECGICLDVCAFDHRDLAKDCKPIKSWAAWSNDECIRRKCSSGGIGFEIGEQLIEKGYKVVSCRYDVKEQRAEHYIATTVEEFVQSIGSKYIQSYTEVAFKQIERKCQQYLITGTPCQIDSFRRMIRKFHCEENFILMDFFCHCVPSMHAWYAYLRMQEKIVGKVTYVSWRNKFQYGWHNSWLMYLKGDKKDLESRWTQGDLFYKLFLGDVCLGKQCQKDCKYKYDKSSADIRIGDLWGITYKDDEKGTSALVAFSQLGYEVINNLKNVSLVEHPFNVVAEGQMKSNAKQKTMAPLVKYLLRHKVELENPLFKAAMLIQSVINVASIQIKKIF